jgi:hypothetical protein
MMRIGTQSARVAPALALGALLGGAGCDDDVGVTVLEQSIQVDPPSLDFGNVQVGGEPKTLGIFVRNTGQTSVDVQVSPRAPFDPAFSIPEDETQQLVNADGVFVLNVSFTPTDVGSVESTLIVRTPNAEDIPDIEVPIQGNGVTTTLEVEPQRLDFRNVVVDSTRTLPVTLTNNADVVADIELQAGDNVKLCSGAANDPSVFCVRFRDRTIDRDTNGFSLAAGETAELEVQFAPVVAGTRSDGDFVLKSCPLPVCDVPVTLTGRSVEAGLRCRPTELDFGAVNPGATSSLEVTCENIANEQITIVSWGLTQDSAAAFEVERPTPQPLRENESASIEVTFAPTSLGDSTGTLRLETDSQSARNVDVALAGSGGGPDIEVLPPQLNFGQVSLIAPSRRNLVVTNTGFSPLEITDVVVDTQGTGSFTTNAPNAFRIEAGETETIPIEFTPRMEGEIVSAVRFISNDADEGNLEVPIRGEGVVLPPCNFSVVPSQVQFGAVEVTRSLRRAFEIRNNGADRCIITAVRLVGGSDPAFSLPGGDIISQEIPPGAAETVVVEFAPTTAGTATGQVEFSISSPTRPYNTVDLSGVGSDGTLLIVPNELGFGTIGVGCRSRARTVTVYNTGNSAVEITSIDLGASMSTAFSLPNVPSLPTSIPAGGSETFDVGFRADARSAYAGAVEIDAVINGTPTTYIVALTGRGDVDATQVDEFEQLGQPKVDILFVIDKTGSMGDEQQALGSNFQAFIQFAEAQGLDYQLGVTTTFRDSEEDGRLVSAQPGSTDASGPMGPQQYRIVTPRTTPSPSAVFASNVDFQLTGGSAADESGMEASYRALSAPRITNWNSGFLRRDAVLSVIWVSDAGDGSPQPVDFYINFFLSIKGFRNTNLFSASAIVPPYPNPGQGGCRFDGSPAPSGRYIAAANRTGGVFQSICTSDWSRSLEDLSTTAFGFKSRFFLTNQPVISTLKVFIDGAELPDQSSAGTVNWEYDQPTNSVNFAPYATPEPGAQIRVEYTAECL